MGVVMFAYVAVTRGLFAIALLCGASSLLYTTVLAGTLDASWTVPSTNTDGTPLTDLAGYHVYYGTSSPPCPGSSFVATTSATPTPISGQTATARITGLVTGTQYFVSVTAVDLKGSESACSSAPSGVARIDVAVTPATAVNFGTVNLGASADQVFTVQNTTGGTVSGSASTPSPAFQIVSGSPFSLVGAGATQAVTVRFSPTVAASVNANVVFAESDGGTLSVAVSGTGASAAVADTTPPTVAITVPTAAATFTTTSSSLTLQGTASDNVGVTSVTWSNDRGGSGTATGTSSWTAGAIPLQAGSNVLTVTATDAAGNLGTAQLTVTSNTATATTTDTTPPTVVVGSYSYTGRSVVTLTGAASDNVGVTQVTWTNSRGGSGTATGTANWTATGIALQRGQNVITVTARDAAGNTATATLTLKGNN